MRLTKAHVDAISAMWKQHEDLARGTDDERRLLTRKIAEQLATIDPRFGTKSATKDRPQSKDAIAYKEGAKLWGWDTINGATREVAVKVGQEGENMTGQHFISVDPTNHLRPTAEPEPEPGEPHQPPAAADHAAVVEALLSLAQAIETADQANERRYLDVVAHMQQLKPAAPAAVEGGQNEVLEGLGKLLGGLVKGARGLEGAKL